MVGGFIYAPAIPGTPNFAYAAVSGNAATGNDVGFAPAYPPALGIGWNHVVVHYRQNDVTRYIVNGSAIAFTSDASPGNTNTFANSILYLAGNPTAGYLNCFLQDVAIYGTNLPSTARFQAHYAARNN